MLTKNTQSRLSGLTKGNALLLITILGFGGSFQAGYHITGLSSPSPCFINSSWNDRYNEPPAPQKVTMIWSLIVSMYAIGGLFGAVSVNNMCPFSRKRAIICNSMISVTGAVMMLTSKEVKSFEMIIVARMLYGYSSGMSLHLMYLGEISPREIRGRLTLTSATFTSLGKLCGQFFGLSEILGRRDLWHVLLCVPVCFSVAQVLVLPFLPEAPRYLFLEKGDDKACKRALQRLWGKGDYKQEVEEMVIEQTALEASPPKSPLQLLKDQTVRWQLITIFIIYFCNQMSGMSAISTFSFDIFLKAGVPKDKIRYVTLGLGISEILTSISCSLLIEQTGRRPLFWGGYAVMSAIWIVVTIMLNLKVNMCKLSEFTNCDSSPLPGAATATLSSELFIQSDRLAAFVLMGLHRWFIFAVLGLLFPFIIVSYCFMLFAGVCLLGSLYTFLLLPETNGKTFMDISKEFKAITVCGKSFLEEDKVETKL
uniref:Solute carrier family 2, facilitated glucose transporter member 5 n=1 Tax=Fundulus heteroclitus TaxID=8078 RepID=A0A3Q2QBD1_FUNHE